MKTKEEILEHLLKNGYDDTAILKICGWMCGMKLKAVDETIQVKRGRNNFKDFISWYETDFLKFDDVKVGDYIFAQGHGDMVVVMKYPRDCVFGVCGHNIFCIPIEKFNSPLVRASTSEEKDAVDMINTTIWKNHNNFATEIIKLTKNA